MIFLGASVLGYRRKASSIPVVHMIHMIHEDTSRMELKEQSLSLGDS